jgi:hypothetical protein
LLRWEAIISQEATEKNMRAATGLLSVVIALAAGYWFYAKNVKATGMADAPQTVISTVGVKSDLLSMAQAERVYQASHGSYASLDELYSSGTLTVRKSRRDGYTYSAETSSDGFTITARCQAQTSTPCPSFSIDQDMQIQQQP